MKNFLTFIIVVMAVIFPSIAKDSKDNKSILPIVMDSHPIDNGVGSGIHRAPVHINIEAFYDFQTNSINIHYDGDSVGEVFLYLNGDIVDYNPEINTAFQIQYFGNFLS